MMKFMSFGDSMSSSVEDKSSYSRMLFDVSRLERTELIVGRLIA